MFLEPRSKFINWKFLLVPWNIIKHIRELHTFGTNHNRNNGRYFSLDLLYFWSLLSWFSSAIPIFVMFIDNPINFHQVLFLVFANKIMEFLNKLLLSHVLVAGWPIGKDFPPIKDEFIIWNPQLESFLDSVFEVSKANFLVAIVVENVEGCCDSEFSHFDWVSDFLCSLELPILCHLSIFNPVPKRFFVVLPVDLNMKCSHCFVLCVENAKISIDHLVLCQRVQLDLGFTNEILWHWVFFLGWRLYDIYLILYTFSLSSSIIGNWTLTIALKTSISLFRIWIVSRALLYISSQVILHIKV